MKRMRKGLSSKVRGGVLRENHGREELNPKMTRKNARLSGKSRRNRKIGNGRM